ncbi:MAG TPA: methyltransferase domain-containing protein, partial [Acidimicrobiales bacterium]|nr:methyltransferase domain-containing protein [Acidimicrobiales bacterium]
MSAPVYDRIGVGYAQQRRPDPRIQARIDAALGDARTVLNVGAGTGSYEPDGAIAVEPLRTMIGQRETANVSLQAVAAALPFVEGAFDVGMAIATVHHWPDLDAGLAELRRVCGRQAIMTWDPAVHADIWIVRDYLPEME